MDRDGRPRAQGASYEEAREQQAEFEELLREHDGDYQAAVDAQRRGEKPAKPPEAPSTA